MAEQQLDQSLSGRKQCLLPLHQAIAWLEHVVNSFIHFNKYVCLVHKEAGMAGYNLYYNVAWPLTAADSNRLGFVHSIWVPHACVATNM